MEPTLCDIIKVTPLQTVATVVQYAYEVSAVQECDLTAKVSSPI